MSTIFSPARLTDLVAYLAVGCGTYRPTIALLNAVTAGLLATVILYLYTQVLKEERWARDIGFAFSFFTLQYLLHTATSWAETSASIRVLLGADWLQLLERLAHAVCSPANNLCFFAAGRRLLRKPKVLPFWIVGLALLTAACGIVSPEGMPYGYLLRFPDGLFSFICLLIFGSALFINFAPQRRPELAFFSLFGALAYGALNLLYAFIPLLAGRWTTLPKQIGSQVAELQRARLITAPLSAIDCLDALTYSAAFLLKILLFLAVFLLILKVILVLAPEASRGLLRSITYGRGKYIWPTGILRALGTSTEADVVALCIRLTDVRDEKVAWWRWLREPFPGAKGLEIMALPPADRSIVAWILRTGRSQVDCPDLLRDSELRKRYLEYAPGMRSFVTVPVRYHGAVIACLNLEWKNPHRYSATTVMRAVQMAELLAPTIHERRQLIALDSLTETFGRLKARAQNSVETIQGLVKAVHDVLSPLATGSLLNLGFRWIWVACTDGAVTPEWSDEDSDLVRRPKELSRRRIKSTAGAEYPQKIAIHGASLEVPGMASSSEVSIGQLVLAVSGRNDPAARPSLAIDYLHRRVIASLLAEAMLAAVQRDLDSILDRLQLEINLAPSPTVATWYAAVDKAAREVGLCWTAAILPAYHEERYFGGEEPVALVQRIAEAHQAAHLPAVDGIRLYRCTQPTEGARHAILLPLRDSEAQLWLGVRREAFGPELAFASPWRLFLTSLLKVSDSVLVHMRMRNLQAAAEQLQVISMENQLARLVTHTLIHDTRSAVNNIDNLHAKLLAEPGARHLEAIEGLQQQVSTILDLINTLDEPVPSTDENKTLLVNATDRIERVYGHVLQRLAINLEVAVPVDASIDVPLLVAYAALSTLVMNAAEAVRRQGGGTIKIVAGEETHAVACRVQDTGPGIQDSKVLRKLFKEPTPSGPGGHGVGLFLAHHVLEFYRSKLLYESSEQGATFTIHFPKTERETNHGPKNHPRLGRRPERP